MSQEKDDLKHKLQTIETVREITNNIELLITFYNLSYGIREWNGGTQLQGVYEPADAASRRRPEYMRC